MIFDRAHWEKYCRGFVVYDCAMMDADRTFYVLVEDTGSPHRDPLPRTRFLFVRANRPMDQKRFIAGLSSTFGFTEIAYNAAAVEFVAVDTHQKVFSYDSTRAGLEPDIPGAITGTTLLSHVTKVVRVGNSIYTVGWPRRICLRKGSGSWALVDNGMPLPKRLYSTDEQDVVNAVSGYTLRDLAGFSETDMYAVGDDGEIWQWDGSRWTRCAFPTNERLSAVACGDGTVYVTTQRGSVWAGRGNAWKLLVDEERSVAFRDCAWFANKLWCGSDYGVWALEGGELSRKALPDEVFLVSGRLEVSPDEKHLLTAGAAGAAMFDGSSWNILWSGDELG